VRAVALRGRLAALLEAGREAEARAMAAETIAAQPWAGDMLRQLGRLLLRGGQPDLARLAFERLVRVQPGNVEARLGLVEALRDQGAIVAMRRAVAKAQADLAGHPGAALVLARIARVAEAGAGPVAATPPRQAPSGSIQPTLPSERR
jgi:predicted Zn-dependent protease